MSDSDFEFEGFQGVEESPIPDMFAEESQGLGVAGPPQEPAEPPASGDGPIATEVPIEQSEPPQQPQRRPRPQVSQEATGIPDPNRTVQKPQRQARDYNAASAGGARQGRTQQMKQGFSQPGQSVVHSDQPADAPVQHAPVQQQPQQQRPAGGQQKQVNPAQRRLPPFEKLPENQVQKLQAYGIPKEQYDMWVANGVTIGQFQEYMAQVQAQMQMQEQGGKKKKKFGKGEKPPKQPKQPKQKAPKGGGGGPGGGNGPVPPKKKSKLPFIIIGVVLVLVLVVVGMKLLGGKKVQEPLVQNYETSGRWALDTLKSALNNYNPTDIDAVVGVEDGDSYLAQEWAYVNNVKIRQEFIQVVGGVVKFQYPQVQQKSTTGEGMVDEAGNPIMIESYMNNGEELTITIPDYDKLAKTMDEKADYIIRMLESAGYTEADYSWEDELINLMLQFILDDGPLPTKEVKATIPIRANTSGRPYIETDAVLDDLLFGSEEFHYLMAKFSQIIYGWTGYIDEIYLTYEHEHNEEYDRWLELFLSYFEADGGVYNPDGDPQFTNVQKAFKRNRSKWEPWYLRDDNNVIQKYEDGTYIVNYFSVKDENGNDWIQPAAEIEVEIENVRKLEDPWEDERGIWYCWIGQHYLETYNGRGSTVTRVGDGSREHPAGIGTTIITKVLGTDGLYHDVKVALMGYWTGQPAIDYAEKFSSRNRGFTTSSPVQLICFEVYVENLENEPIEFLSSEMTLTDRNSNLSSRTGTMYDFTDTVYLEARGNKQKLNTTILNDWATSTELAQKYVCWGKSFGRRYSMVYFDCLAGTGDIPTYSAYKQFTGQSSIDEDIKGS